MMRIAFVSRELFPFGGGGLGTYVTAAAEILSNVAEVTILTTDLYRDRYRELREAGSPLLPPEDVRIEFIPEPNGDELGGWYGQFHVWSARAYEALKRAFPEGGPDLVEFPDYLGEGAVTVQAKQTLDPALRNTRVAVRLYTTGEMAAVLNGCVARDDVTRATFELERIALSNADFIVWAGGDIRETYSRFYGDANLASGRRIRHPAILRAGPGDTDGSSLRAFRQDDAGLKILYVGRLERRKGVQQILRGLQRVHAEDWRLTLVGNDTPTAPLGLSMRDYLGLSAEGDPRVSFLPGQPRSTVVRMIDEADIFVSPSLWECWPNTVLEALHGGCPVAATPVGGHVEMVQPGINGWLFASTAPESITDVFDQLVAERDEIASVREQGGPRRVFAALTDEEDIRSSYLALAEDERAARRSIKPRILSPTMEQPLVSIVIPYFQLDATIEESVQSAVAQTWAPLEVIVVNDGSTREKDWILAELAASHPIVVLTQVNSGLGAARNFGIRQSRGRFVVPLDADNVLEPEFVARCVEILERDPDLAYVTSWLQYIDAASNELDGAGYRPLWNLTGLLDTLNLAGDAVALIRKSVFDRGFWYDPDMTSYEDWLLYRDLRDAGLAGAVVPAPLVRYRIRDESMVRSIGHVHHERLLDEMHAHGRYRSVEWTSSND